MLSINDGVVTIIGGEVLNDNDSQLFKAINDKNVTACIVASKYMPDSESGEAVETANGHCYGATYSEKLGKSVGTNFVNVQGLSNLEKPGAEGSGMMHEVTEAYGMGCVSLNAKRNLEPAYRTGAIHTKFDKVPIYSEILGRDYGVYRYCHLHATPAPNEMSFEQSIKYKNLSPQYFKPFTHSTMKFK